MSFTAILMKILHLHESQEWDEERRRERFHHCHCYCCKSKGEKGEKLNLIRQHLCLQAHKNCLPYTHTHTSTSISIFAIVLWLTEHWLFHIHCHICKFYVKQKQNSIITQQMRTLRSVWVCEKETSFSMLKLLMHIILNHHKFWDIRNVCVCVFACIED